MIILNEDQQSAVNNLRDFILFDRVNSEYILSGPAGTGKSTIIRMAIKDYKGNVFLTATTNQAVDVLKTIWETQSKQTSADIYVGTIHKLLGLYLDIEYNEETESTVEVLKFNPQHENLLVKDNSLVIIDEASMLSSSMYKILNEAIKSHNIKVIYMGDFQQLPPIKENVSKVFDIPNRSVLTKVMRQKEGSNLLSFIQSIRNNPTINIDISNTEVIYIKQEKEFIDKIYEHYNSEEFKKDPTYIKSIAWTNKRIKKYNDIIKQKVRGNLQSKLDFIPGERLICTKQYSKQKTTKGKTSRAIILNSSQEVTLESISIIKKCGITAYEMNVRDNRNKLIKVFTVKPSNFKTYMNKVNRYKREYYSSQNIKDKMKLVSFMNTFAVLDHAYSITAHRSQGSTYKNVFIDYTDIRSMLNLEDENINIGEYFHRCLYTAVSRASEKLYILI